jgi:hypothetical protein
MFGFFELGMHVSKSKVLTERKQGGNQGISLFPAFSLFDLFGEPVRFHRTKNTG